jgi:hypothetical protein
MYSSDIHILTTEEPHQTQEGQSLDLVVDRPPPASFEVDAFLKLLAEISNRVLQEDTQTTGPVARKSP